MKILAIVGSMRKNSTTKKATQLMAKTIEQQGVEVDLFHLAEQPLPIFDSRKDESTYPENVHTFMKKVDEADAYIWASPEYHGSVSGALKNALDFIDAKQIENKLVAIIGTAGGRLGATKTVDTLHQIARHLNAWPLPKSPTIPKSWDAFNDDGTLKDASIQDRLEQLGVTLVTEMKRRQ